MGNMEEKINWEEHFKNMETISYKRIVEILNDKKNLCSITFTYLPDSEHNKNYYYIDVKYVYGISESYVLPDQDPEKAWSKFMSVVSLYADNPEQFYNVSGIMRGLYCRVGNNYAKAPKEVAEREIAEFVKLTGDTSSWVRKDKAGLQR